MFSRRLLAIVGCVASVVSAARGRTDVNGRAGWARKPLAVGALGGLRFGPEPYLLEFHGANCDHCETMVPLMHKLFKIFRLNVKRHMVWEGTSNFRLMAAYDMETGCKGLPFFYNRRTNKTICGATTWTNFRNWALCRDCKAFLPPTLTPEQEEEAKPKKMKQDSILERMKAKAQGRQKAKPKIDGYDERT
ncbi:unnamed protein product [Laminaria digitata]